jgi:putative aminopeptidase FrvX
MTAKWHKAMLVCAIPALGAAPLPAQTGAFIQELAAAPAVSGYERVLSERISRELRESYKLAPQTDNLGNVYVTVGSGAPHRLIVTAMDEPGYVVSRITPDGYLRVQRLPQAAPNVIFDSLHFAQPVNVLTNSGKAVPGVFAGLSVHLQPGRRDAPKMDHPDEMYIDIGAQSEAEARAAGVHVLDPVALSSRAQVLSGAEYDVSGPAAGLRAGCVVLMELAERMHDAMGAGTTTVAFVTQQWTGGRGLDRMLEEIHPDEMIWVGLLQPPREARGDATPLPGIGVLLGVRDAAALNPLESELRDLAAKRNTSLQVVAVAPPRIAGYAKPQALLARFAEIGPGVRWPFTPAETVSANDGEAIDKLLESYLQINAPQPGGSRGGEVGGHTRSDLEALALSYGASGHEAAVRETVKQRLPEWARKRVQTDAAGNLILHINGGNAGGNTGVNTGANAASEGHGMVFVAHMDEIGYEVRSIEPDGRLAVDVLGGGYAQYFLGHTVLVHKSDGTRIAGVLELPAGWDKPDFEWPHGARETEHVFIGTKSAAEDEKLGVKPGDWVTIPKEYRALLGTRANARSFDDRVGCAALIEAVKSVGPSLPGRDVTFIWSTEEEVGLKGAAAAAERMAAAGNAPEYVFAVDTFVSSDSPLESKRFADAEIGKGFVIRAVDNSNIAPRELVMRVVALAEKNKIPVQYGVTGGGNDGAVFERYGTIDIPLSWPLRYSHSPGEVIDTRDLDSLARIIAVLAREWQ